jgi:hypothetical protein
MQRPIARLAFMLIIALNASCDKAERDTELPEIIMSGVDYFPQNCDTVYIGESFTFRALFKDNFELGSYSIDIHHNFDHHSHSTDVSECPMAPVKQAVNPLLVIVQFEIPAGLREYNASRVIDVPENVDPGDYDLMVRLTDRTGWQAIRGISIKVIER